MHDVDVKFIEKILRKYNEDDSILIKNIRTTPACEKGENFMSVVLRIIVNATRVVDDIINGEFRSTIFKIIVDGIEFLILDFTVSLIAKQPYQSELLQEAYKSNDIFTNEVIAYNEIIPTLKKYSKLTLPLADCLHADEEVIILQDLTVEQYEMNRNQISMSIEECLAVIQVRHIFSSNSP